jgi:hypothetical protein
VSAQAAPAAQAAPERATVRVRTDLRPDRALTVQGDRARTRRTVAPAPVVAYRVHYRLATDSDQTHHVSALLWCWEVGAFVRGIQSVPGASLVSYDCRPDGIEEVRGWPRDFDAPDPLDAWRAERAAAERERVLRLCKQVDKDIARLLRTYLPGHFIPAVEIAQFLAHEVPEHLRELALDQLRHHL